MQIYAGPRAEKSINVLHEQDRGKKKKKTSRRWEGSRGKKGRRLGVVESRGDVRE